MLFSPSSFSSVDSWYVQSADQILRFLFGGVAFRTPYTNSSICHSFCPFLGAPMCCDYAPDDFWWGARFTIEKETHYGLGNQIKLQKVAINVYCCWSTFDERIQLSAGPTGVQLNHQETVIQKVQRSRSSMYSSLLSHSRSLFWSTRTTSLICISPIPSWILFSKRKRSFRFDSSLFF